MKKLVLTVATALLLLGAVQAHTSGMVKKTCPLCKHDFTCQLDMSGTQFGMRLDLKPLGPITAPWRIPVCPKCRFVLYDDDIPADDLEKCKEIVHGDAYKKHSTRASHFLLGLLYEGLGKKSLEIAHVFLQASWQEEAEEENLRDDLRRSLGHFDAFLKEPRRATTAVKGAEEGDDEDNSYETAQLLKGELLRRLGRFDKAKVHLAGLQKLKPFQGTFLADIVRFEIALCDNKDAKPHEVSEVPREQESEPAAAP